MKKQSAPIVAFSMLLTCFTSCIYKSNNESKLPVIKANSIYAEITEGDSQNKVAWTVVPSKKPDIYITHEKNSKVIFRTDIDSISFVVKPNNKYQFIVLLNNKDRALTEIHCEQSFLDILKRAAKYNNNDHTSFPGFSYQSPDVTELKWLRNHYNLDSIAGKGDDFSQVKNLLAWLHNLVPHNGQLSLPNIRNAVNLVETSKREKRGINCRGLAIALNECYLSMGFKSRYVTCLPKDSLKTDRDYHVINSVFLKSLNKWIWIDPTYNSYILDENHKPLSISEVRQRIIENRPLEINPEANYNGKKTVTKDGYLFNYMAKNLYILECPVHSEYDYESQKKDTSAKRKSGYIRLLPLDYINQQAKTIPNLYTTCNENLFWENAGS